MAESKHRDAKIFWPILLVLFMVVSVLYISANNNYIHSASELNAEIKSNGLGLYTYSSGSSVQSGQLKINQRYYVNDNITFINAAKGLNQTYVYYDSSYSKDYFGSTNYVIQYFRCNTPDHIAELLHQNACLVEPYVIEITYIPDTGLGPYVTAFSAIVIFTFVSAVCQLMFILGDMDKDDSSKSSSGRR